MSQGKKRPIAKRQPEDTLLEEIQEAAAKYKVLSVEMDYAGSSHEVGFTVYVAPEAIPEEVLALSNAMSALMEGSPEARAWNWTLGIYRGDDLLRVVGPYDSPQFICAACGSEQEEWADWCLQCKAQR